MYMQCTVEKVVSLLDDPRHKTFFSLAIYLVQAKVRSVLRRLCIILCINISYVLLSWWCFY